MDSWEWNKIIGAVLGTLIFVMVVRIAADAIYDVEPPAKPGYVVEGVAEEPAGGTEAAPKEETMPDWGTVLAKADVDAGKKISQKCEQCHTFEKGGPNKIGPDLWAIVDSPRGEGRGGFDFSAAMKKKGGTWTYDELFKFIKSPGAYIPGTKMSFAGIRSEQQRIDLIAYLRTVADSPAPIPPPKPAAAAPEKPAEAAPAKAGAAAPAKAGAAAPAKPAGTPAQQAPAPEHKG